MINRREFLAGTATVAGAAKIGIGQKPTGLSPGLLKDAPNILIFMPDQQLGSTVFPGSPVVKPHMDKFFGEGVAFTSAHCPAPHCCPSRTSFLSGMYPSEHGVYNNVSTDTAIHLNPFPATPFWGRWLREAGYQMGYAGKLHVGRDIKAEDLGFDSLSTLEQDGLPQNEKVKTAQWNAARRMWETPTARKMGEIQRPEWVNIPLYATRPDSSFEASPDYKIVEAGIVGMKRFAANKKPWCVMVSNSGAHDNYDAPKRFVDLYDPKKVELPPSFPDQMNDKPRIYQRQRYQVWSQMSDDEYRDAIRHYWARCTMADELFGNLLRALDETGQAENTLVLYVSDHGDYAGAHGLWFKGVPAFEQAYHIPAVVRWPKGLKSPGRQVDAFVDQVDFGPTFLDAAGVTQPQALSGTSLMPFLRNESPQWRDHFCTQMNGVEFYYSQRAVTTKKWKYVHNGFDYDELYDLTNDPHEMKNLAFPDLEVKASQIRGGQGVSGPVAAWPPLSHDLDIVRKDLLEKMWTFAAKHQDILFNPYGTVALAPYGPGVGADPGAYLPKARIPACTKMGE